MATQNDSRECGGDVLNPWMLRRRIRRCADEYLILSQVLPVAESLVKHAEESDRPSRLIHEAATAIRAGDREAATASLERLASEFSISIQLRDSILDGSEVPCA